MVERYIGCLLGIAVGDALGAPVEGMTLHEIKREYGYEGIQDFKPYRGFEAGFYTDDTQMTLATVQGILDASFSNALAEDEDVESVYGRYLEWLKSQYDPRFRRGPGMSCLTSLQSGVMGTLKSPINNSKGCGGVMRTAPAGLAFAEAEKAFIKGAEYAAITHGHPGGYLSAGFLSSLIALIVSGKALENAIDTSVDVLKGFEGHKETLKAVVVAISLSSSGMTAEESIRTIGLGWVGEEALGISIYCSLRFKDDWRKAVLTAVNHDGDSDSTGSITGGIMGALIGVDSIPKKWALEVENSHEIRRFAEKLHSFFC